jgi:hypothetical protein
MIEILRVLALPLMLFGPILVLMWATSPRKPRVPTPCPYCPQPDRDSVFDAPENCHWINPNEGNGSDPPCVCDNYGTRRG